MRRVSEEAAARVEREEERAGDVSAEQEGRALIIGRETRASECKARGLALELVRQATVAICRVHRQ